MSSLYFLFINSKTTLVFTVHNNSYTVYNKYFSNHLIYSAQRFHNREKIKLSIGFTIRYYLKTDLMSVTIVQYQFKINFIELQKKLYVAVIFRKKTNSYFNKSEVETLSRFKTRNLYFFF